MAAQTPDELGDYLARPILAILATRRRDDTILLSPVWYEWRDGGFDLWADVDSGKVKHIERDPRVTIVAADALQPYRGLEIRGIARIEPERFAEVLERTAIRYLGPEAGAEMAATYANAGVAIRIEPGDLRMWDWTED